MNNLFMDEVNNISVAQLDGARRLLEYMHLEHLVEMMIRPSINDCQVVKEGYQLQERFF